MTDASERSLGDDATFAGHAKRQRADVSIGDERTHGDKTSGQETLIDDSEVVDLEARYKIEGELGQGGMGAVLLATDTRLDRKVAIKRILGEAAGNRMSVQRFLTEAKSIAALNQPNIVQIYDYGRAKDGPFLIMEYVDGGSLLDRCKAGALPLEDAVDLACQLCDGLAKAHDLGIIHRDIKPANVLLTKDGTPKLTDFGLAKAQSGDHGQTMTGAVLGTPDFMPPEQRRDASEVDHRSDLWSLAATVYQMVTGRSPKIIRFDLLPPELTKVLGKALEDEKDSRYQSARELRDAIKSSGRDSAVAEPSLGEGQCPGCGTKNDGSRKFCTGCGGSLIAPCLGCAEAIPIWNDFCGSCGTKQSPLLEKLRAELVTRQAEAEQLLGDCDFAGAAEIARQLCENLHPRLKHLTNWAVAFVQKVDKSQAERVRQMFEAMTDAGKHEVAHDYLSAAVALEAIPAALREGIPAGMRESAKAMLSRVRQTLSEVKRLDASIRQLLAAKSLDYVLPEVERLLSLQPNRQDVQKLRSQLLERQARARDAVVATARAHIASHDYENAVQVLGTIPTAAITQEVVDLRKRVRHLVRQLQRAAQSVIQESTGAVQKRRYEGVIAAVREYLAVAPRGGTIAAIMSDLETRHAYLLALHRKKQAKETALSKSHKSQDNLCLLIFYWGLASLLGFVTPGTGLIASVGIRAAGFAAVCGCVAEQSVLLQLAIFLSILGSVHVCGADLWLALAGGCIGFVVPLVVGVRSRRAYLKDEFAFGDVLTKAISEADTCMIDAVELLRAQVAEGLALAGGGEVVPLEKSAVTTSYDQP